MKLIAPSDHNLGTLETRDIFEVSKAKCFRDQIYNLR